MVEFDVSSFFNSLQFWVSVAGFRREGVHYYSVTVVQR